jgi:hypothetical protein
LFGLHTLGKCAFWIRDYIVDATYIKICDISSRMIYEKYLKLFA